MHSVHILPFLFSFFSHSVRLLRRMAAMRSRSPCRISCSSAAGITPPTFYYHFRDKYDLVAWIFYSDAFETDVLGLEEAAAGLRKMKREYLFYMRAYEDSSQNALWSYMLGPVSRARARTPRHGRARRGASLQHPSLLLRLRRHDAGMASLRQHHARRDRRENDVHLHAGEHAADLFRFLTAGFHLTTPFRRIGKTTGSAEC